MFSKSRKPTPQTKTAPTHVPTKPAAPSLISTDLTVVGDLKSDGEIQIDGRINGDICSDSLLVGESAIVTGEIVADRVTVHGAVNGQIRARKVNLAKTARVVGDILHDSLAIETGAFLEGHCKRIEMNQEEMGTVEAVEPKSEVESTKPAASGSAKSGPTIVAGKAVAAS
ncbi:MAG: bactofilin family protein [Magnetovibrionaceae bacterium]